MTGNRWEVLTFGLIMLTLIAVAVFAEVRRGDRP